MVGNGPQQVHYFVLLVLLFAHEADRIDNFYQIVLSYDSE